MSETPTAPATPVPPSQPGPIGRLVERVEARFDPDVKRVEQAAAGLTDAAKAFLTDHASTVYDVTGDLIGAIKLIDPSDTAALAAFQALLPKVVAVAGNVSDLLEAALKSG